MNFCINEQQEAKNKEEFQQERETPAFHVAAPERTLPARFAS
jgi:hypothetical protein